MRACFLIFVLLAFNLNVRTAAAQPVDSLRMSFRPVVNDVALELTGRKFSVGKSADSISISTFRFYISAVSLWQDDEQVWMESNSYHLMDAEVPEHLFLRAAVPAGLRFNRLRFNLGIDSATNATGVQGGELDPVKGMYWAWQSGYINMKLEGVSPVCKTRKNAFQFHLGGFRDGTSCMQSISLPVRDEGIIVINTDIGAFLSGLDLASLNTVMSPGAAAVALSKICAGMFSIEAR